MSFMTKYADSSNSSRPFALHDRLEFPEGHDFKPIVNRRKPEGFLDFCASYLPRLRKRPDYRQRRLERCCDAEFDLAHPERVPAAFPGGLLDDLLRGVGANESDISATT